MFKSGLTSSQFREFAAQVSSSQLSSSMTLPFVYADKNGVKVLAQMFGDGDNDPHSVFAISVAEDGWVEYLAMYDN